MRVGVHKTIESWFIAVQTWQALRDTERNEILPVNVAADIYVQARTCLFLEYHYPTYYWPLLLLIYGKTEYAHTCKIAVGDPIAQEKDL